MKEIEVGLKLSMKGEDVDREHGWVFFGLDEVNNMLRSGARVTSIQQGGIIMHKMSATADGMNMAFTGFTVKVVLDDSGTWNPTHPAWTGNKLNQ